MAEVFQQVNADEILRRVIKHAGQMALVDEQGERGYAHLGWMLLEVADMQYWRVNYDTFRAYLEDVSRIAKKTPDQLRLYFLTVRDLSDTFTAKQLEDMGITKAIQLRKAKDYALVLPQVIVEAALSPAVTSRELRKIISTTLRMSEEEGDWMDCEMEFMVDSEQRATIAQAIDVAMHTEPLTKSTISKSAQMLDVMLKFAQEFLGAHSGDGQ